jgi:hypothetical protein
MLAIACFAVVVFQTPAFADKLLDFRFNEASGATTLNAGLTGGMGTFTQQNGSPIFSSNIPAGPFAPIGNISSVDMGLISATDGNRGVDFPASTVTPTIGLTAFTVTGWLNARDTQIGGGGNRVISTWPGEMGRTRGGFEVVQESNGRLRFSVNEAPDFPGPGPFSTAGRLTIDAGTSASNWIFFAITYDAGDLGNTFDGLVNFYFGTASAPATFDTSAFYDTGAILNVAAGKSGTLTIGNFLTDVNARPTLGAGSRVFRGLIDDVGFYSTVLTEDEIRAVQVVPEPSTACLIAMGVAGLLVRRKRVA